MFRKINANQEKSAYVTYSNIQSRRRSRWVDKDPGQAIFGRCDFNVTWVHSYWYVSGWRAIRVLNINLARDKQDTLSTPGKGYTILA
jgi:hypothetical protein